MSNPTAGALVKRWRKERKVSQAWLAARLGLAQTTVSDLECEKIKVDLRHRHKLAEALSLEAERRSQLYAAILAQYDDTGVEAA